MVESTVVPLSCVQFSAEESQKVWVAIYIMVKNGSCSDITDICREEKRDIRGGKIKGCGCSKRLLGLCEGFLLLCLP